MGDFLWTMFLVIVLMCLSFLIGHKAGAGYSEQQIINECQENLPRDQYCIIIAVPEKDLERYQ